MHPILRPALLVMGMVLIAGCGKPTASSLASSHSSLFPSGQLKADWDTVTAAMQTNGYLVAGTTLRKMQAENPSPDQMGAINDTLRTLNDEMIAAADKGDAGARQALQEFTKGGASRTR